MAQFYYIALDASGKKKKGVIDTDNIKQARKKIKEMGLSPLNYLNLKIHFQKRLFLVFLLLMKKRNLFLLVFLNHVLIMLLYA